MVVGVHAVVRWQVSQDAVVEMWLEFLPFAMVPLWQVAHAPGATPLWLKVAGIQPLVR